MACKSFTTDFYKLVDINSESIRLRSNTMANDQANTFETDSDDDESIRLRCGSSPTPSEAGLALVTSCSSTSESISSEIKVDAGQVLSPIRTKSIKNSLLNQTNSLVSAKTKQLTSSIWRQSTGWRRVSQNVIYI